MAAEVITNRFGMCEQPATRQSEPSPRLALARIQQEGNAREHRAAIAVSCPEPKGCQNDPVFGSEKISGSVLNKSSRSLTNPTNPSRRAYCCRLGIGSGLPGGIPPPPPLYLYSRQHFGFLPKPPPW